MIKRQAIFHGMKKNKKKKLVHRSHTDPTVINAADGMGREGLRSPTDQ